MSSEADADPSPPKNPAAEGAAEPGSEIAALDEQRAIVAADVQTTGSIDGSSRGEGKVASGETGAVMGTAPKVVVENQQQPQQKEGTLVKAAKKKSAPSPRSSRFHGVTRLKWSGKYEAHLWDNTVQAQGRKRKGKHVYLGSYVEEEHAARAHDLAVLKYCGTGPATKLNFTLADYEKELEIMKSMSHEEFVAYIRRQSSCFSRGTSSYRGVTRRKDGKWQARIGRVADNRETKDIYLGTFDTEEEAAEAYDIAAIELRGVNAVTNFSINSYSEDRAKGLELEGGSSEALLELEGPSDPLLQMEGPSEIARLTNQ